MFSTPFFFHILMDCHVLLQGWSNAAAMDMNEFYHDIISKEERNRIDSIEPFDEYEVRKLPRHMPLSTLFPCFL